MKRGIPSLDGLRAISIAFVLLAHLSFTRDFPSFGRDLELARFGTFGVRIFFVISGYLITSLLLKELDSTGTLSLRRFYFRRAMRLFPAAYAMIAVVAALTPVPPADLAAALTYTMNYRFGVNSMPSWNLGHLWSLAVEEQFYLIWPFLLCVLRRRRSVILLLGCLLIAPVARMAMHYRLLVAPVQFLIYSDALATGCLLSLLREQLWADRRYRQVLGSRWFFVIPALAVGLNYLRPAYVLLMETVMNIAVAMTIDWAMRNYQSLPGRFLNLGLVRAIGVLSYSLYLWQELFLNRASHSAMCAFPMNITLAAGAAMISYYCVEQPFLRLRARLEKSSEDGPAAAFPVAPEESMKQAAGRAAPL